MIIEKPSPKLFVQEPCPWCQKPTDVLPGMRGKMLACPHCQERFQMPCETRFQEIMLFCWYWFRTMILGMQDPPSYP